MRVLVLIAICAVVVQVKAGCLCGGFGEGKDLCHLGTGNHKGFPMVVRPAKLPKFNLEELTKPRVVCKQVGGGLLTGLKPIGDLCSCKQAIVTPAHVPRPACAACAACSGGGGAKAPSVVSIFGGGGSHSHSSSSSSSSSSSAGYHSASYSSGPSGSYDYTYKAAADPVSLSLAYKAHSRDCGQHEDKLNFGFRKLPVDGSRIEKTKHFPEENMFRLNGEVVELKPVSCKAGRISVDEEALEQLVAEEIAEELEHEEEMRGVGGVKQLSYGEIGFGPAKLKSATFVEVPVHEKVHQVVEERIIPCNDGYIPGNMIFKNTPREEVYTSGPGVPMDCPGSEEEVGIRFIKGYSGSSSSSSASSSSSHSSNSYSFSH